MTFATWQLCLILAVTSAFAHAADKPREPTELEASLVEDGYVLSYDEKAPGKIIGIDGYTHKRDIGPERLRQLAQHHSLRRLQVTFDNADEPTFKALGELQELKFLVLSSPFFPPKHFKHLAGLSKLEKLYVTQPLRQEGLDWVCQLKRLQSLTISSQGFTQEDVQRLAVLPELDFLKLNGTLDVTPKTRQAFRNATIIDDGSFHRRGKRHPIKPAVLPEKPPRRIEI